MGSAVRDTTTTTTTTTTRDDPERRVPATQFPSTPRGARRARRFAVRRMAERGFPPDSDASCTVALLVAELAANAVRHGRVSGRNFSVRIGFEEQRRTVRIEVADAGEGWPPTCPSVPGPEADSGRGLVLVDVLATRWGVEPRAPLGKTVWAEAETDGDVLRTTGELGRGGG